MRPSIPGGGTNTWPQMPGDGTNGEMPNLMPFIGSFMRPSMPVGGDTNTVPEIPGDSNNNGMPNEMPIGVFGSFMRPFMRPSMP